MRNNKIKTIIALICIHLMLTLPMVDALIIENVRTADFKNESTTITWETDEDSTSVINYGIDDLTEKEENSTLKKDHLMTIPTQDGETYRYNVESCNQDGNCEQSEEKNFIAGEKSANLTLEVDLPRYVTKPGVDIKGKTRPFATVNIYIDTLRRRSGQAYEDGIFIFSNVPLPNEENTVKVEAVDGVQVVEAIFEISVDTIPPVIEVGIPEFSTSTPLILEGNVSEKVRITYSSRSTQDTTPPDKINNLQSTDVEENQVSLEWEASTALDLLEYAVYRDNARIATVGANKYTDNLVNSEAIYDYRVSGVDITCNEGELSNKVTVKTLKGGSTDVKDPEKAKLSCERTSSELEEVEGDFSIALNLVEGENELEITAEDKAGNKEVITAKVRLDLAPPQFLETNLEELSPSYIPDVRVKGKLSEKAAVTVFLNGKAVATELTEENGGFSVPVVLERNIAITREPLKAGLESGEGFENKIKLKAVDLAGFEAETPEVKVIYALCGFGTWYTVYIGQHMPDILTPRLMIEGIQQIGIPFNVTYAGNYESVLRRITSVPIQLSPSVEKDYDNGMVQVSTYTQVLDQNHTIGYIQIAFNPFDPLADDKDATMFDKEENISNGRKGQCLVPGFGCVRLFLELEIPFQEKIPKRIFDPNTQKTIEAFDLANRRQRTCIPIEVMIDKRIPPDVIPENFLKKAISFLDGVIDLIDTVLDPLLTVGTYVLYSCGISTAWLWIDALREGWNCKLDSATYGFKVEHARTGMCDIMYEDDSDEENQCMDCQDIIQERKNFEEDVLFPICDRVMCPSAPTLQTHVKSRKNSFLAPIDVKGKANEVNTEFPGVLIEENNVFAGSDCAAWARKKGTSIVGPRNRVFIGYTNVKEIYQNYLDHKTDSSNRETTSINCDKLHPATAECCGFEYQKQWGPACGVGALGIDLFDEIKESTCLSSQGAGQNFIETNAGDVQCKRLWNSVAGFCEPNTGATTPQGIQVMKYSEGKLKELNSYDGWMYIWAIPKKSGFSAVDRSATLEEKPFNVGLGFAATTLEFEANTTLLSTYEDEEKNYLTAKLTAVTRQDMNAFFTEENIKVFQQERRLPAKFKETLDAEVTRPGEPKTTDNTVSEIRAKEVYEQVINTIGVTDQEYIVVPESGFLRATQCVCFPAVISYLELWRNIFGAVNNCLRTILLTGDGSAGACEAVLSTYVCDLFYDIISCAVQKFNSAGAGKRSGKPGIGDMLGVATGAGSDVGRTIRGRYGETAMYNSIFSERKLVHSACLWAFTGTWDLDVAGLFRQGVDAIPIESQGFFYPCNRRFISYNPLTNPRGLATWTYEFGVGIAAGADLRYSLELQCSSGFSCDSTAGFKNGECDCNKGGEKRIVINPPELGRGQLKKNDILSEQVFYTIQAGDYPSNVRYDKAILRWEYINPKTNKVTKGNVECDIGQAGGSPPAFCAFDVFSLAYRCQFGYSESAIQLQSISPLYSYKTVKTNIPTFAINEPFMFNLAIKQKMPSNTEEQHKAKKFLYYEVRDHTGSTVHRRSPEDLEDTTPVLVLETDGDYTRKVNISLGNIVKERLEKIATPSNQIKAFRIVAGSTNPIPTGAEDYIDVNKFNNKDLTKDKPIPVVISLTNETVSAYIGGGDLTSQGFRKGLVLTEGDLYPHNIGIDPYKPRLTKPGTPPTEYSLEVLIKKRAPPGERVEIALPAEIIQPTGNTPCATKQPQDWEVTFNIYDATEYGEISLQLATDPATGEAQSKTEKFKVTCLDYEKDKSEIIQKEDVAPTVPIVPEINVNISSTNGIEVPQFASTIEGQDLYKLESGKEYSLIIKVEGPEPVYASWRPVSGGNEQGLAPEQKEGRHFFRLPDFNEYVVIINWKNFTKQLLINTEVQPKPSEPFVDYSFKITRNDGTEILQSSSTIEGQAVYTLEYWDHNLVVTVGGDEPVYASWKPVSGGNEQGLAPKKTNREYTFKLPDFNEYIVTVDWKGVKKELLINIQPLGITTKVINMQSQETVTPTAENVYTLQIQTYYKLIAEIGAVEGPVYFTWQPATSTEDPQPFTMLKESAGRFSFAVPVMNFPQSFIVKIMFKDKEKTLNINFT